MVNPRDIAGERKKKKKKKKRIWHCERTIIFVQKNILRVMDQNGVSRNFDIFTFLHENVQQSVHFDVMMLILLSDH